MASFRTILTGIVKYLAPIEHIAATVGEVALPQFAAPIAALDAIVMRVQSGIVTAEQNPLLDGKGQLKNDAVVADLQSGLEITQGILAMQKKKLTFDQDKLQDAINAQVAAYNAFRDLKASFKIEDLN